MRYDKIILGNGCVVSSDTAQTGLNNNVVVCGSSGSGKTMSITEPRLLETFNTSICVTVTKRRIVNRYKKIFFDRGYNVWDLNLTDSQSSDMGFDPLAYINTVHDITHLAEAIVKTDASGKLTTSIEPFWENEAVSLLSAEIAYIWAMEEDANFTDVLELHDQLRIKGRGDEIQTSLDHKFKYLEDSDPNNFAITCWKSFRNLPMRTASCVYATLNSILDTFFDTETRKLMANDRLVDIKKLATKKTILFITTSPVNASLQRFVNMFYGYVFKELFEFAESLPKGILPQKVDVICDDFATGGKILNFDEYISIFREKGVSVTLLLQSESQLASIYGHYGATTIINNCDTYVFTGSMDLQTAKNISERTDKPLEEILSLPIGKEIILRRGNKPIYTERYDILKDKNYQKIFEKNAENPDLIERETF